MAKKPETILQEIVDLDGDCLSDKRCRSCPFRTKCLSEFTSKKPPAKKKRAQMALDALWAFGLMDEDEIIEWRKNHD